MERQMMNAPMASFSTYHALHRRDYIHTINKIHIPVMEWNTLYSSTM